MRIKEYLTDELLMIANNVTGEYSDKQIRQAKLELYNRGVNDEVIADIMEEKEEAFMKRLDAAARAEEFYLLNRYYFPSEFFSKLKQLKKEKYDLKFKQRIACLLTGDITWFIYWLYSYTLEK